MVFSPSTGRASFRRIPLLRRSAAVAGPTPPPVCFVWRVQLTTKNDNSLQLNYSHIAKLQPGLPGSELGLSGFGEHPCRMPAGWGVGPCWASGRVRAEVSNSWAAGLPPFCLNNPQAGQPSIGTKTFSTAAKGVTDLH